MSKLPLETRPLRLAPDIAAAVEEMLHSLSGKKLEAAQEAVLKVYQSRAQMDHVAWLRTYREAIAEAIRDRREAATAA